MAPEQGAEEERRAGVAAGREESTQPLGASSSQAPRLLSCRALPKDPPSGGEDGLDKASDPVLLLGKQEAQPK